MHRPDLGSNAFGEGGIVISPPNQPLHQPKPHRVHLSREAQRCSRHRCIIEHRLAASQVNGKPFAGHSNDDEGSSSRREIAVGRFGFGWGLVARGSRPRPGTCRELFRRRVGGLRCMERIPARRVFTEGGVALSPANKPLHQPKPHGVHLSREAQRCSRHRCIIEHRLAASQVNGKPFGGLLERRQRSASRREIGVGRFGIG